MVGNDPLEGPIQSWEKGSLIPGFPVADGHWPARIRGAAVIGQEVFSRFIPFNSGRASTTAAAVTTAAVLRRNLSQFELMAFRFAGASASILGTVEQLSLLITDRMTRF